MPRKQEFVTIDADGRDKGRIFILTEMDAWAAIRWCAKAMLALAQTGAQMPSGALAKAAEGGPETLAILGTQLFAFLPEPVALALMEEAKTCVAFQSSVGTSQPIYKGDQCQVEEPSTWFKLLQRLLVIHLGFFKAVATPNTD